MSDRAGLPSLGVPVTPTVMFESDLLVDDDDAIIVHFRRHGSLAESQRFCDAAVPGLSSWRAGRQVWGGAQHRKFMSGGPPQYSEPPLFVHRRGVIPADVLDVVDQLEWAPALTGSHRLMLGDRWSSMQPQRLIPAAEELLTRTADELLAGSPFGFEVEPASVVSIAHRRPDGSDGPDSSTYDSHVHEDGGFDEWRRWATAVLYFTAADEYEGGDLLIVPTGERLRPGRGDAVLIRGDVPHQVSPLVSGARTALTAAAAEPRWWIAPRDEIEAADPDERCRVVDRLWTEGRLTIPALRRGLSLAWGACHWPEEQLPGNRWVAMFKAAGYISGHAGNATPAMPLAVYRACDPGRAKRLTWTMSMDHVRLFQSRFDRAEVWRAVVPPAAVLARFGEGSVEVVVDPSCFDGDPPWATPVRVD